jgi:hypothetical protein
MTGRRFNMGLNMAGRLMPAILLLLLFFSYPALGASGTAGEIISFTPGAAVEREGEKIALALKSPVYPGDTIITDANGRLRIWLDDDSCLSLGPDTVFTLEGYESEGNNPRFQSRLPQGLVRILTGKIVEANPGGFSVTTPEATVGIRGTIVVISSRWGKTVVYVENTLRQVLANGEEVPSGHKAIISRPGGAPVFEPLQPQDRRELGRELAFAGSPAIAAAAPEPGMAVAGPKPEDLDALLASADSGGGNSLASLPLNDMTALPPLNPSLNPPGPPPLAMGRIEGQISDPFGIPHGSFSPGSVFSFDVNLQNGNISNAASSGHYFTSPQNVTWSYIGGGGSFVTPTTFVVNAGTFSGTLTYEYLGVPYTILAGNAAMSGTMPSGYTAVLNSVYGTHVISDDATFLSDISWISSFYAAMNGLRTQ